MVTELNWSLIKCTNDMNVSGGATAQVTADVSLTGLTSENQRKWARINPQVQKIVMFTIFKLVV